MTFLVVFAMEGKFAAGKCRSPAPMRLRPWCERFGV